MQVHADAELAGMQGLRPNARVMTAANREWNT
jgi:hypothetical protein